MSTPGDLSAAALSTGPSSILDPNGRNTVDDGRDCGKWTKEEDVLLKKAVDTIGARNWKRISTEFLGGKRSDVQCLHRWQKVLKPGLIKGPWTKEEDETIMEAIKSGVSKWSEIATLIPGRIGKQCRERWFNHLDPSIKKGGWTEEEDRILVEYQEKLGNRWCEIAKVLPGRSENAVKNRWNSAMRRKFQQKRGKTTPHLIPAVVPPIPVATVATPTPTLDDLSSYDPNDPNKSNNKAVRNNVRLPPDVILVEQPSNKNSVIAAREKIRRHQEQMDSMVKIHPSSSSLSAPISSSQPSQQANMSHPINKSTMPNESTANISSSSSNPLKIEHSMHTMPGPMSPLPPLLDLPPFSGSGSVGENYSSHSNMKMESHGLPVSGAPANGVLAKLNHQSKQHEKKNKQDKKSSSGENCNSLSNTKVDCPAPQVNKRSLAAVSGTPVVGELNDDGKQPRKRAKKPVGFKLSKAVNNLRDFTAFEQELPKRKAFANHEFSDFEKQTLHQKVLSIIHDAEFTLTNLSITMVWSRLAEFYKKGGLDDQFGIVEPLPISVKGSSTKGKPRDLRVQCSLDPSTWTLSGGTPTVFGNSTTTPIGEMLSMMPSFSGINPSIFSPTPRHGMNLNTPFYGAFPTPTAAEIKKIDQLDDPLFPDSMFFHMDASTLAGLNASFGGASVLSPIFRQPSLTSSNDQAQL